MTTKDPTSPADLALYYMASGASVDAKVTAYAALAIAEALDRLTATIDGWEDIKSGRGG